MHSHYSKTNPRCATGRDLYPRTASLFATSTSSSPTHLLARMDLLPMLIYGTMLICVTCICHQDGIYSLMLALGPQTLFLFLTAVFSIISRSGGKHNCSMLYKYNDYHTTDQIPLLDHRHLKNFSTYNMPYCETSLSSSSVW